MNPENRCLARLILNIVLSSGVACMVTAFESKEVYMMLYPDAGVAFGTGICYIRNGK